VTGAGPKNQMLRHFYFTVDGVPEDIVVETLDEIVLDAALRCSKKYDRQQTPASFIARRCSRQHAL